jgi:2-(1,2-epoxy-1,2-dihydrophenyl)acetyl-CoA isomerase
MPLDAAGEESIVTVRENDVLALRLNRPERLNAFSRDMYELLDQIITEAAADRSLRALVITGTGRSFSTGGDLKQHLERRERGDDKDPLEYIYPSNHAFETLLGMEIPTVAIVNGLAYAAGLIVTLCCDIAISSDSAKFCVPESRTGRAEPWSSTLLPSRVGRQRAASLVLGGQPIDAETALTWGLVSKVVPGSELAAEGSRVVESILGGSPRAQYFSKRILAKAAPTTFDLDAIHTTIFSPDTREGTEAFVEKRKAAWVRDWAFPDDWAVGAS